MFGEPSTKASNDRARSLAKRPAASSAESHEDKTFGKVITVQASTLTEAEKLAWSSSPIIKTGPMRGKELIAYRSRKLSRKFHFLLAGPSSLDKHAYDYYCLGCWNNHREDCRVTVRSSTQEFVVTDPDRTSAGRHACIEASSPRPSGLLALAKEPLSGLADDEAESLQHDVAETPARSIEYFSKHYQAKLKFSLKEQGKNGQAYYVCWKCRTLQRSRALTSIRMQSTKRPKTDTRTLDDSQQTSIDHRAWAQAESSRPIDCAADQAIREQATTAGNDESSCQREVLQYPASVRTHQPAEILNTTHASAQMTFLDFRQIFKIPQSTQKLFIFKRNDEEWDVIRDDEKGLPVFNGRVEAKAYSED
ncbi:hypothetical protein AAVH_13056 [Aphelenchoides avenae]|nr:hypothetical protein AAVH_13056 [Aphelenchus avenae]